MRWKMWRKWEEERVVTTGRMGRHGMAKALINAHLVLSNRDMDRCDYLCIYSSRFLEDHESAHSSVAMSGSIRDGGKSTTYFIKPNDGTLGVR